MKEQDAKKLYTFMGKTTEAIKGLRDDIKEIKENHLVHLNGKIDGLLFTVLGSIAVGTVALVIKMFIG